MIDDDEDEDDELTVVGRPEAWEVALEIQHDYDMLNSDCKALLAIVYAYVNGRELPLFMDFEDKEGYPFLCASLLLEAYDKRERLTNSN